MLGLPGMGNRLGKFKKGGDEIKSKVVDIRNGWMGFETKTGVNIITIKVEKVKLEVGGFGSRGDKIKVEYNGI